MDLTSGKIDMAIRVGWLADSTLQARKIGSFRQLQVGAPAFADQIAATLPKSKDLAALPFIANMALREPLLCQFSRSGLERRDRAHAGEHGHRHDARGTRGQYRAGGGLSVLPDFLVAEDLASGDG